MGLREDMPLLARHEGKWEGEYVHVDPGGAVLDRHRAEMTCAIAGDDVYHQTNRYTWDDGRVEVHEFPGRHLGGGRCGFDTDRLKGEFWELDESTIYLRWQYKAEGEDLRLFELIVLSETGDTRSRVWQWIRDGVCVRRTLINERRVG
ncbi:DUF3598 domain-containing protein [Nonomuraea longispora]|uniref:DUF3598 domain-containing protein n=1 Tax=Nonomuraea longispora TaxID=1848320 RepID=A0A4V2XJU4_9ACTN|nr:DUF3598 domain-containing protein [Nonomuraea longispora]TDC03936.1 DUF3598 domain-containing protein [Nonomuraea longispora]